MKTANAIWHAAVMVALGIGLTGCPDEGENNTPSNNMAVDMEGGDTTDMGTDDGGEVEEELAIDMIAPSMGPVSGGTEVTITGAAFSSGATVFFGDVEATSVTVTSDTEITATTPAVAMAGPVSVRVVNPGGDDVTRADAFTYNTEVETDFFCQLQMQSPVTATAGMETPTIYAFVFADGTTQGAGQGMGIDAEFGVGQDTSYESYDFSAMSYNVDTDGLTPGDLANDEYGATVTLEEAGEYRYVARFKREDETEWTYCDLDGSDNGVEAAQLGTITVEEAGEAAISYCQITSPDTVMVEPNEATSLLSATVFAEGVTQGAGQGDMIEGQVGWGADAADYANFTYEDLSYMSDADGINVGDLANDSYTGDLTIDTEGTYRYVARFRLDGGEWFYCDLDGHSGEDPFEEDQLGTIEVSTQMMQPTISFCQTETATANTQVNQATGEITGQVYAAGVTDMQGQGAGIDAELVWGPDSEDPTMWTNAVSATFKEDADNGSGMLNNDRWAATITPTMEGDYGYAFRFTLDGGATYAYCDTDGSDGTMQGFEPSKVGELTVSTVNLPDACNLQYPYFKYDYTMGNSITFFGRVEEAGVTGAGAAARPVAGELWVGPIDADPETEPMRFTKVTATYNSTATNLPAGTDEYEAMWTPLAAGEYKFLYRFSVDGGTNYTSCDIDGGTFEPGKVGAAKVLAMGATPDYIDYCEDFSSTPLAVSLTNMMDPTALVEFYEQGVTNQNDGSNAASEFEVEVGYGPLNSNPGLPGVFTWSTASFAQLAPFNMNNYQYEPVPYDTTARPAADDYHVIFRVRKVTGTFPTEWTYCDRDAGNADILPNRMTELNVTP